VEQIGGSMMKRKGGYKLCWMGLLREYIIFGFKTLDIATIIIIIFDYAA